ncbi:MAG TPA: hypothetical protein VLG37_02865 [Candidatus Saccharimonadales bacterium]|nr:hypothetical protein [Candidatus Saccharimonadales bacterium]
MLVRAFDNYLGTSCPALDASERIEIIRKSHRSLIEMASCSPAQLSVLFSSLFHREFEDYVTLLDSGKLTTAIPLLDFPVQTRDLERVAALDEGLKRRISLVKDLPTFENTVGCPVLFRPKQVENLWQWVVDGAVGMGLI